MNSMHATAFAQDLSQEPWAYTFLEVCRWVEARTAPLPRIGEHLTPRDEKIRLGQTPASSFAPREIDTAQWEQGNLKLFLYGLGLYGPSGPLPLHLTEEIHERQIQKKDHVLADFLNMFHHRWLSLFYRACAQGHPTAGLDRKNDERFSVYIASLTGSSAMRRSEVSPGPPPHAELAASGHLVRHARNPVGLIATLEHYFNISFKVEEYAFEWLHLEREDVSCIGQRNVHLGRNAVLGRCVPDRQCSLILHIFPDSLAVYQRLLPGADWNAHLKHWLRCFTGLELRYRIRLTLPAHAAPRCRLGHSVRLGCDTWFATRTPETQLKGRAYSI